MVILQKLLVYSPVASFIFLATLATTLAAWNDPQLQRKFILYPWELVREKKYYTLITSGLIHANFMHLLFNMLSFYYYAFILERAFVYYQGLSMGENHGFPEWLPKVIGHVKFTLLYLASLVLADVTCILKNKNNPAYMSLGASGAISGLIMAFIMLNPVGGVLIMGLEPWQFGLVFLGISYLFSRFQAGNINHEAHLWGGITGAALTLVFYPKQALQLWEMVKAAFG